MRIFYLAENVIESKAECDPFEPSSEEQSGKPAAWHEENVDSPSFSAPASSASSEMRGRANDAVCGGCGSKRERPFSPMRPAETLEWGKTEGFSSKSK
jgi:hypothetical protein